MSPTFSNTPSSFVKVADVAVAPAGELNESFTESDSPKAGRLLTRVFGSTIKRAVNRVVKTKTDMEERAEHALEDALTRHKDSCIQAGETIQHRFKESLKKAEYIKDGSAARGIVNGTDTAAAPSANRLFDTVLNGERREAAIENALTRHSEAIKSAATSAGKAKQRVSNALSHVAESIAVEAGVGVNVIRKSAAYKVAATELSMELGTNLRKNEVLTDEQKQKLSAQVTADAETIKQYLSTKIETILVDNKSVDISRSSIRERLQEVVEESVNSISELTESLRLSQLELQGGGSQVTTMGPKRSTIVDAVGGTFSEHSQPKSLVQPQQPQHKEQEQEEREKQSSPQEEVEVTKATATAVASEKKEDESVATVKATATATPKEQPTAEQPQSRESQKKVAEKKPALTVLQGGGGGDRTAEATATAAVTATAPDDEVKVDLGKLTSKQLISVARQLKATGRPELVITKYGRMKKAELLEALSSDAVAEYLKENEQIIKKASTVKRAKKKKSSSSSSSSAKGKSRAAAATSKLNGSKKTIKVKE